MFFATTTKKKKKIEEVQKDVKSLELGPFWKCEENIKKLKE